MAGVVSGFWRNRHVLITGHTGFKGAWMCAVLRHLGARVTGVALAPDAGDNLFAMLSPMAGVDSHILDIRDRDALTRLCHDQAFDVVIHMAAQSLVRRSYDDPFETFDVNIRGSLTLLDALVSAGRSPAIVVVTSDKVYRNDNSGRPFREDDALGGDDPYSASKGACEIAVHAFAAAHGLNLATARAGNVVGGGDFSIDRLLPDAARAARSGQDLVLRHPEATRPWQHVLDVVFAYLSLAQSLVETPQATAKAVNIGPEGDGLTVGQAVSVFFAALGRSHAFDTSPDATRPEKLRLELDTTLGRDTLALRNRLSQSQAVQWSAAWYLAWLNGDDPKQTTAAQIKAYEDLHVG